MTGCFLFSENTFSINKEFLKTLKEVFARVSQYQFDTNFFQKWIKAFCIGKEQLKRCKVVIYNVVVM